MVIVILLGDEWKGMALRVMLMMEDYSHGEVVVTNGGDWCS